MTRYLLGRIGQALAVLAVTFTAAFLLLQAVAVLGLAGVEWTGLRRVRGIADTA